MHQFRAWRSFDIELFFAYYYFFDFLSLKIFSSLSLYSYPHFFCALCLSLSLSSMPLSRWNAPFWKGSKKLENASELVIVNFFAWRLYTHTLTLLDFFFFFLIWRRKKKPIKSGIMIVWTWPRIFLIIARKKKCVDFVIALLPLVSGYYYYYYNFTRHATYYFFTIVENRRYIKSKQDFVIEITRMSLVFF